MRFFLNHKTIKGLHNKKSTLFVGLCTLLLVSFSPGLLFSQLSRGGMPASFAYDLHKVPMQIDLTSPDIKFLKNEDLENEKMGFPERVGVSVKADINLIQDLYYEILPNGVKTWRVMIQSKGAFAIGLYFGDFQMTPGCRVFAYDGERNFLRGSFTLSNNNPDRLFSIELIPGDRVVVEVELDPEVASLPACRLSEISYLYKEMPGYPGNRGVSDDCEVNINCPEGDNWQYQKHGVVRIYVKQSGGYFWCTGSLLNNTLQNNVPFLLTADHCAPIASPEDLSQWIFYFNYDAPACENPTQNPVPNSMTGAIKLANASTAGSDFLLLRLIEDIPLNYEPYYNGWSIENIASPNGVTIHHPAGDIKKLSTYTQPIESSQWYGTPGTHWKVFWAETETNWGVTEGGSSGAPLFDNTGKVIGSLTGGQAACEPDGGSGTGPDQPDYYGKFSYSWDQNSPDSSQQLKYWLDPLSTGIMTLTGKNASLTAAFQASATIILAGNKIEYTNMSSGLPVLWEWDFEGGIPETYFGPDPGEVLYPEGGAYNVRLIVSDGLDFDTLMLKDYIHVVGKVYPNPTIGAVNIYLEDELPTAVRVDVFSILGQKVYEKEIAEQSYPVITLDLSGLSMGLYTVRLELNQHYIFARVILMEP